VVHVVSRSVRDAAALLDVTHGPAPGDMVVAPPPVRPYAQEIGADPGRLRVGLLAHTPGGELHASCATAVGNAAARLEALGHHVEEAHPAVLDRPEENGRRFIARWSTGAALSLTAHGELIGRELTADDVEPATWLMAEMAKGVSGVDLAAAIAASAAFTRAIGSWWGEGWDLLLTPTLGGPPPRLGEISAAVEPMEAMRRIAELVPFTTHFNVTGQPAISLPLHWDDAGLPIGVQLVAAYGREDVLLRVAAQLEEAEPWADRRPPVAA
jgi:amidase